MNDNLAGAEGPYCDAIGHAISLYNTLKEQGVEFTEEGFPLFRKEWLMKEFPANILPLRHCATKTKRETFICHFQDDQSQYSELPKLDKRLSLYMEYAGICGFDFSPRFTWNPELQKFNILLGQLQTASIAIAGVPVMPNFRVGNIRTISALKAYPPGCLYAVGTIGCSNGHIAVNEYMLEAKITFARPSGLAIYGPLLPVYRQILNDYGIPFRVYGDYQAVSRARSKAVA